MYLVPEDLRHLKDNFGFEKFQLSIFYVFENQSGKQEVKKTTRTHNVVVLNDKRPVLVVYNPFQHIIADQT